jgi:hypothetical protein
MGGAPVRPRRINPIAPQSIERRLSQVLGPRRHALLGRAIKRVDKPLGNTKLDNRHAHDGAARTASWATHAPRTPQPSRTAIASSGEWDGPLLRPLTIEGSATEVEPEGEGR